jgi:hypothetical protein
MKRLHCLVALSLALLMTFGQANSSVEGLLRMSAFALESPGIGDSGLIKVSGAQSERDISLLLIEAFGKKFNLSPEQLKDLSGFNANGIQITYEGGYEELGGRTVYVIFSRGFTSGSVRRRFVSINESGLITVRDAP